MKNIEIIERAQRAAGIDINTPCHTFAYWKSIGYKVRKGEKATFKARIWKYTSKKNEDKEGETASMFMKTASFFTDKQVEAIA